MKTFSSNLSPYQFAKAIEVRPQMVYNYISKGYIKSEVNELGKKFLTPEVMNEFVEKRNKKKNPEVVEESIEVRMGYEK